MKSILRGILVGIILQALAVTASACPECRAQVKGGIYDQDFSVNLLLLLLPVIVLVAIGVGLYFADEIAEKAKEQVSKWQAKEPAAR
jgi:H+/Cl- antiporter ClcA